MSQVQSNSQAGPSSKKRPHTADNEVSDNTLDGPNLNKVSKIHPFFTKKPHGDSSDSPFAWHTRSNATCLHAINLNPIPSSKIAAFDLDGTVIKSSYEKGNGGGSTEWEWWRQLVPAKLRQLQQDGYSIVIITNQNLKPVALKKWKEKMASLASSLKDLPFWLFAATARDVFRKPMPGMWWELEKLYNEKHTLIDKASSFYVGDAAGRKGDFAGTDRKWANNLGLRFYTPEEYFLGLQKQKFVLEGFEARSLSQTRPSSRVTPTSSPLLPLKPQVELVLFVGYPGLGKSMFFHNHFKDAGYRRVNQDILKTRDRCVKSVRQLLSDGLSCVVDNTNRDKKTRDFYISVAKELGVPVRCFEFEGSIDLAWHNNLYRAFISNDASDPKRPLVPYSAFTSFRDGYEKPSLEEGFTEIKYVHWIFEGTPEEQERWSMWLQVDGK